MHGAAPFGPAAPPWRADDYGGAEVFASPYGAPPYGATARRPWRGRRRTASRGACILVLRNFVVNENLLKVRGTLGVEALVGGGAPRTPGRVQARPRGTVDCAFISSHPALIKCIRTVFAPRPLRFRAFVRPDPRICDEHLLETTFQRATPPRFAVQRCRSGDRRRGWLSCSPSHVRPSAALCYCTPVGRRPWLLLVVDMMKQRRSPQGSRGKRTRA